MHFNSHGRISAAPAHAAHRRKKWGRSLAAMAALTSLAVGGSFGLFPVGQSHAAEADEFTTDAVATNAPESGVQVVSAEEDAAPQSESADEQSGGVTVEAAPESGAVSAPESAAPLSSEAAAEVELDEDEADDAPAEEAAAEPQMSNYMRAARAAGARSVTDGFATGGSGRFKNDIQWMVWNPQSGVQYQTILGQGQVKNNEYGVEINNGPSYNIATATTTMTRNLGDGGRIETTCNLSNPTRNNNDSGALSASSLLKAYTPGGWAGDGLDNLYNVGGTGVWTSNAQNPQFPNDYTNNNSFRIGLRNDANHANISFTYSCSAKLVRNGVETVVPLQGLVFADAEASSTSKGAGEANQSEWIRAWPTSSTSTSWYVLDTYRNGCDTGVQVTTQSYNWLGTNYNGMTMTPGGGSNNGQECAYSGTYTGPNEEGHGWGNHQHNYRYPNRNGDGAIATMFLKGATSAQVQLQGRGYTAVALGVIIETDFGDAPESYGVAGSLFQPSWTQGAIPNNRTVDAFRHPHADLTTDPPSGPHLGARIDAEQSQQFSDDAMGDDNNPSTYDDEDALSASPTIPLNVLNGTTNTFTLPNVACSGGGKVRGWIDWNGNGVFDANEGSTEADCNGTATLTFTVPQAPVTTELVNKARTYLRLRAYLPSEPESAKGPTGVTTDGEVEDYAIQLPALLKLTKDVSNEYGGTAAATDWTLTAAKGQTTLTYESGALKYVEAGSYALNETGNTDIARDGYTWDSLVCMTGAVGTTPSTATNTSVTNKNVSVSNGTRTDCVFKNADKPGSLSWDKVNEQGELLPGSTWTLKGTRYPDGKEVVDCTQATCPVGEYLDQDPTPGKFKIEKLHWGNYTVQEKTAPEGYILNTTVFEFETIGHNKQDVVLKPVDGVVGNGIVNKPKVGTVTWLKVDFDNDKPLAGSEWTLTGPGGNATITDCVNEGQCGTGTYADTDPRPGYFNVTNLPLGDYTLKEKAAPAGYQLETTEHTFTISDTHLEHNFDTAFKNKKQDVPDLPLTGGLSADAFIFGGVGVLIVGAIALVAVGRNRKKQAM